MPCTSVCPCKIHVIKKLSAPQRTWQLLQSSCGETAAGPTPGLMRRESGLTRGPGAQALSSALPALGERLRLPACPILGYV